MSSACRFHLLLGLSVGELFGESSLLKLLDPWRNWVLIEIHEPLIPTCLFLKSASWLSSLFLQLEPWWLLLQGFWQIYPLPILHTGTWDGKRVESQEDVGWSGLFFGELYFPRKGLKWPEKKWRQLWRPPKLDVPFCKRMQISLFEKITFFFTAITVAFAVLEMSIQLRPFPCNTELHCKAEQR